MKARKYKFAKSFLLSFLFLSFSAFAQDFSSLSKLADQGYVKVTALAIDLNTQQVLAKLSPTQRLTPASTSKLVVASKVLETWGASKTFDSKIYMRGHLQNGVLKGDLIFYGVGDPSLTNEKIWFLTSDVARFGIKKVTGRLIVNNSYFGKVLADNDRNLAVKQSQNAYNSPLSSAAVNFSVIAAVIFPAAKVGAPATIAVEPFSDLPSIKVKGSVITADQASQEKISVVRTTENGKDLFQVTGTIPQKSPAVRVYRSVSNADIYAGEVLVSFLRQAGVQIGQGAGVETTPLQTTDQAVAEVQSFPLDWQLRGLLEMSNNFIADTLTLDLLNKDTSGGAGDLAQGGKLLQDYMEKILEEEQGMKRINIASLSMSSGSGLTPSNQLSASDLVAVLSHVYSKSSAFPPLLAALSTPGGIGTLKNKFSSYGEDIRSRIWAKTGSLHDPVTVASLAGYGRLKTGHWIAFACILNGIKNKPPVDMKQMSLAMQSDLGNLLSVVR